MASMVSTLVIVNLTAMKQSQLRPELRNTGQEFDDWENIILNILKIEGINLKSLFQHSGSLKVGTINDQE